MVTLSNLGAAYVAFAGTKSGMEKLQLMERASEALQDAHEYHKNILGEDHRDTLVSANHLAALLKNTRKPDQAEELYKKTLNLCINKHGEWDALSATTTNNIGILLKSIGRYDEALENYNRAFNIRSKTLGEKHPDTVVTMHNIAELHLAKGDNAAAKDIQEKILELVGEPELQKSVEEELKKEAMQSKQPANNAVGETKRPVAVDEGKNSGHGDDIEAFRYQKVWSPSIPHERRRGN